MAEENYYVSVDTGGTFTDGYVSYPGGSTTVKVPTTDHDLTVCFRNCIDKAADKLEKPTEEFLVDTDVIRFSTTIGTNTIIERSGPKIGLIVTGGNEDDLFRAEDGDGELIASDDLVVGVEERTSANGEVIEPVNADEVQSAAKTLMNRGAKLLLISFANSYHDETNEERARTVIETEYPPHYLGPNQVLTANEVSSRPGYRTRTYTALVNAYVHRPMARSLYKAEDDARNSGYSNPLLIGQSTGGVAGVSKTVALHTYNSGPVAGVLGADAFRKLYDLDSVMSADMGGTSIDLGTIVDGELDRNLLPEVAGLPVHVPMIDVHTAGAGGGSIASVRDGELSVGPESAGAEPGPACYDLGGFDPTTTDADVALGYIDPDYFLGGDQQLNAERAEEAIERQVADALDVSVAEAALQIRERVDQNIADSIESQLAERGEDPEDVTLIAYGGAGPTHCCTFAEKAGLSRVITAPAAAEFSAFGGATLDVEHRYSEAFGETITGDAPSIDTRAFDRTVEQLEAEAIQDMAGEGFDEEDVQLQTSILARRGSEVREVTLPSRLRGTDDLDPVIEAFDADAEEEIDLDTVVLTAVGPVATETLEPQALEGEDPSDARKGSREAYWPVDGWEETGVYQREDLRPGNVVEGRALIEATDTTYVVPSAWTYRIDEYGNGIIER
ncbi:hydantoinase/oxoprolinase family protein [Halobellus ordinarius]|uniref:hydantoinase/oxoprolinase family protein n=1 Tax=Halobellus ordinarius TaxID=3075120 RepID=UPI0028803945|nr:hydantoinase/oxoprolinase family protein [Halobellus sp. ZY16]